MKEGVGSGALCMQMGPPAATAATPHNQLYTGVFRPAFLQSKSGFGQQGRGVPPANDTWPKASQRRAADASQQRDTPQLYLMLPEQSAQEGCLLAAAIGPSATFTLNILKRAQHGTPRSNGSA
jgi:hypothetical protein